MLFEAPKPIANRPGKENGPLPLCDPLCGSYPNMGKAVWNHSFKSTFPLVLPGRICVVASVLHSESLPNLSLGSNPSHLSPPGPRADSLPGNPMLRNFSWATLWVSHDPATPKSQWWGLRLKGSSLVPMITSQNPTRGKEGLLKQRSIDSLPSSSQSSEGTTGQDLLGLSSLRAVIHGGTKAVWLCYLQNQIGIIHS